MRWDDKPYHSLNYHYKEKFGEKIYKLALNGNMTCPNRDGFIGTGGCIFCSSKGSGDFTPSVAEPIDIQLAKAKSLICNKTSAKHYIAYFQAFTNTYAPVKYLEQLFFSVTKDPQIIGISIATRPDCLGDDVIELLDRLNRTIPVYVELGLQTTNSRSVEFIRRGYDTPVFDEAVVKLKAIGVNVVAHMIIGLPHETFDDMLATAMHIADCKVDGIKLQLLHILKDTDLASVYETGEFNALSLEEYCDIIVSIIERLPPEMVIHRITGDGDKDMLIAPLWSLNKRNVLNTIQKTFKIRDTFQGKVR